MNDQSLFEDLKKFFQDITEIPFSEWAYILTHLKIVRLNKGDFLFKQGDTFTQIGYVKCGLIYTYYLNSADEIRVKNFAWEGRLISPYVAQLTGQPSNFTAVALEPTTLIALEIFDIQKLQKRHPCWEKISRVSTERLLIEREKREYQFLATTFEERINSFKNDYAVIFNRIPNYLIASYLGIAPESYSRMVKKLLVSKKN